MKVAGVKGIRLIMGAAKDERGSVFCNTKQWEVLWLPWRAGLYKRPLSGWVCSGASNTVLYRSYGRDHLWGCEASKSVAQAVGRCSSISPLETSGTRQALKGAMTVFHHGMREIQRVSVLLSGICIRRGFGFKRNHRKPIYMHKLTVLELCGIDVLPAALCIFCPERPL